MTKSRVLGSAYVVGGLTLLSRLSGLAQSMFLAHFLGAGAFADAYAVAFRLPNLFRRFTAEGTMASAFIPTLTEVEKHEGNDRALQVANRFLTSFIILLSLGVLITILLMKPIGQILTVGRPAEETALTVLLGRIMFPYLALVSMTAGLSGLNNFKNKFAAGALAPIFWNLGFIGFAWFCFLLFPGDPGVPSATTAMVCATAVLAGGLAQLAVMIPSARQNGFHFQTRLSLNDVWVIKTLKRMGPGILTAGVYPINALISTALASQLPTGSQIVLFNSNMMGEMILGLFAMSVATASLPQLARLADAQDTEGVQRTLVESLSGAIMFCLPASVGMALLAEPIVGLIFYGGAYGREASAWTALTLQAQCIGIIFIAAQRVTTQGLYAFKDYRGAMIAAVSSLLCNVLLSVLLMKSLGTQGLALANGLSSALGVSIIAWRLRRHTHHIQFLSLRHHGWRFVLATIIMGIMVYIGGQFLNLSLDQSRMSLFVRTIPLVLTGGIVYFGILLALREKLALGIAEKIKQSWLS